MADDTHVYIVSGRASYQLVAVDKKTKDFEVIARTGTPGGAISVAHGPEGYTAGVRDQGQPAGDHWRHQGRAIPRRQPCPWKAGSGNGVGGDWRKAQPPMPQVYAENAEPTPEGKCEAWFKADVPNAEKDPAHSGSAGPAPRGGRVADRP